MKPCYIPVVHTVLLCLYQAEIVAFQCHHYALPMAMNSDRRTRWFGGMQNQNDRERYSLNVKELRLQHYYSPPRRSNDECGADDRAVDNEVYIEEGGIRTETSGVGATNDVVQLNGVVNLNGQQSLKDSETTTKESCQSILDNLGYEALEIMPIPAAAKDYNGYKQSDKMIEKQTTTKKPPRENGNFIAATSNKLLQTFQKRNGFPVNNNKKRTISEIENKNGVKLPATEDAAYCIRVQAGPCQEIASLDATDILRKIEEVKRYQSKFRKAELYDRTWVPTNDSNDETREKRPRSTFTVMQFNTLAEGLSSGPMSITPFRPASDKDENNNNNNKENTGDFLICIGKNSKNGQSLSSSTTTPSTKTSTVRKNVRDERNYFGGFTQVPLPHVCLEFSLRRWRLLEVILDLPKQEIQKENGNNNNNNNNNNTANRASFNGSKPPEERNSYQNRGPDILAMEEVDRYHDFFQPALSRFGYDGLFVAKPNAPGIPLGWYSDGCALFWKTHVFDLVSNVRRNYKVGGQVYIVATLRHKVSGRYMVAAATHLKAQQGPKKEKRRTLQAKELLQVVKKATVQAAAMENAARRNKAGELDSLLEPAKIPYVIMGDFNTEPGGECRTCISSFTMDETMRPQSAYPLTEVPPSTSTTNDNDNVDTGASACTTASAVPYTTWKTRGATTTKHVIDYIFHNCGDGNDIDNDDTDTRRPKSMQCTHILSIPEENEVDAERLPSFRYPSDHMMLASQFSIC